MFTKKALTTETYPVTLDPTVSLADQIKAGNYAFVSEHYALQNFPLTLTGKREIVLFDPRGFAPSHKMIARMKAEGYVPATLDDALAMGATYPDRQTKNPILFLGTNFRDRYTDLRVPILSGSADERKLDMAWFDDGLFSHCLFAAIRES